MISLWTIEEAVVGTDGRGLLELGPVFVMDTLRAHKSRSYILNQLASDRATPWSTMEERRRE